jgi:transcriptional regulator with XRE-family HTH domain
LSGLTLATFLRVSKSDEIPGWSDYLRAAMQAAEVPNAAALARDSGVNESQISRWLRGVGQPDLTNLRRIAPILKRPLLELAVAAGHLSSTEAKVKDVKPPEVPVRHGVSTDGLDDDQERQLAAFAEFLRSQNPAARKRP